jgi:hypothetical protein
MLVPGSIFRGFLAWVMIAAVCQSSVAQTSADWQNVLSLPLGTQIEVKTRSGVKYRGELEHVTSISLIMNSDERAFPGRTVRTRELQRDEIRELRLQAKTGSLLTGGAIGAGAGVGLGAALDAPSKSHEYRGTLMLVFGLLGGLIGVAIAHHNPPVHGQVIYRVP